MSKTVLCPECGRDIIFIDIPVSGQLLRCAHCDVDLEIVDAQTMELDWAYKPPVFRDELQDFGTFLGAYWTEYADGEDGDGQDNVAEGDNDIWDKHRTRGPVH